MHLAYIKAIGDKSWTQQMADQGLRLLSENQYAPAEFGKHTAAEVDKWRTVITEAKISLK
jgi:hypothetical protein